MDLNEAKAAFVQEAREMLDEMEKALLLMEQEGASQDSINAVFRATHTIKGSAGMFGWDSIVQFAHHLENAFDRIRSGTLSIDDNKIALFLACEDAIRLLIESIDSGKDLDEESQKKQALLTSQLKALLVSPQVTTPPPPSHNKAVAVPTPPEASVEVLNSDHVASDSWHISLRLAPDTLRNGVDPISLLRYLGKLGSIVHVETVTDGLPPADKMLPETLYLGFEIQFNSSADKQSIFNTFEFVSEGSFIRILPPRSKIQEYLDLIESLPEPVERLGEILMACKALTQDELDKAVHIQKANDSETKAPLGQILVEQASTPSVVVAAALNKQQQAREKHSQETKLLKVEVSKLDALINLVGELVIANASARMSARQEGAKDSEEILNHMASMVDSIRDAALGLRMVPIGEVFHRFPRMVRDVSKDLGKKVDLVITGAETELDKSMVEKITDPLTHIIRNAMDHGFESVEQRLAAGKPENGTLSLNAYHDSGSIVIEVADDGAGMNRTKILQKAREKGLVSPDQTLNDAEILNLIFAPGFSTAETVTNLSGRGVGMDVVRRNIEALRGEVDIGSVTGKGSTIRIRLPLTLAIIDGFQVRVGNLSYVVPLDLVQECADLANECVQRNIVRLREEPLPFLRLRNLFSIPGEAPARESLLVVQYGTNRVGLVVDQLMGELQAVIKPMGDLFAQVKGIVGTTILGNGNVALILDIPHLAQFSANRLLSSGQEEKKTA